MFSYYDVSLNVRDNNDDVFSLHDVTDVDHDTCTYADFHKALQKHPSREIDDFGVILFRIYRGIGEPRIVSIFKGLAKLLRK